MSKLRLILVVLLAAGVFVAIPATAKTAVEAGFDELGIAVTLNKLELTDSQMQQVYDILVGIASEANALQESRQAFTEEMVQFTGDSDELEAALSGFRSKTKAQAEKVREAVQRGLDDLKGILTIEQGEILRSALMQANHIGLTVRQPVELAREQNRRLDVADRDTAVSRMRGSGQGAEEEAEDLPVWLEQMSNNHPKLAEQMANRWADRSFQRFRETSGSSPLGLQALKDQATTLGRVEGGRLLALLEQVVDILETKLQYVQ